VKDRLTTALFARSQLMNDEAASAAVREIWQSFLPPATLPLKRPNIVMIGQSLDGDIGWLRAAKRTSRGLELRLLDDATLPVTHVFDTYYFAHESRLPFPSRSLGFIAASLDLDPRYRERQGMIKGWHNASNDAAYTMIAALLLASRDPSEPLFELRWTPKPPSLQRVMASLRGRAAKSRLAEQRAKRELRHAQPESTENECMTKSGSRKEMRALRQAHSQSIQANRKGRLAERKKQRDENRSLQSYGLGLMLASAIGTSLALESGYPALAEALAAFSS
jgi:hypothetical protein